MNGIKNTIGNSRTKHYGNIWQDGDRGDLAGKESWYRIHAFVNKAQLYFRWDNDFPNVVLDLLGL